MAKKAPTESETQARARASANTAAAAAKISEKMPPKKTPNLSGTARRNLPTAPNAARAAETAPVADAADRSSQPRPRPGKGTTTTTTTTVSRTPTAAQGTARRARRALNTIEKNPTIAQMGTTNINTLRKQINADWGDNQGALENAETVAAYVRRVRRADQASKKVTIAKRGASPSRTDSVLPADIRITNTLNQDTTDSIAEAADSAEGRGNAVVKAAIEDEMRWGGSDGEDYSSVSDKPRTGRGGPGNPMYIRTGSALRLYGTSGDQDMFTPTPDEIIKGARTAVIRKARHAQDTQNALKDYKKERDELVKGLESADHPDDQESYKDAIAALDKKHTESTSRRTQNYTEGVNRGAIIVRPDGAPDDLISGQGQPGNAGPGTWKRDYDTYRRRSTKVPLTLGQFVRAGTAIEAKRDRIGEVMQGVPLGAPRGDTQPNVSQGRQTTLGGALIAHPDVAITRTRVPYAKNTIEKARIQSLQREHNKLVAMGSKIPVDQIARLEDIKEKLKEAQGAGETVVAGELASRQGVRTSVDPSRINAFILNKVSQDTSPTSGYAAVALQGMRQAALRQNLDRTQARSQPMRSALSKEDRRGNPGRGPGRTRPPLSSNVEINTPEGKRQQLGQYAMTQTGVGYGEVALSQMRQLAQPSGVSRPLEMKTTQGRLFKGGFPTGGNVIKDDKGKPVRDAEGNIKTAPIVNTGWVPSVNSEGQLRTDIAYGRTSAPDLTSDPPGSITPIPVRQTPPESPDPTRTPVSEGRQLTIFDEMERQSSPPSPDTSTYTTMRERTPSVRARRLAAKARGSQMDADLARRQTQWASVLPNTPQGQRAASRAAESGVDVPDHILTQRSQQLASRQAAAQQRIDVTDAARYSKEVAWRASLPRRVVLGDELEADAKDTPAVRIGASGLAGASDDSDRISTPGVVKQTTREATASAQTPSVADVTPTPRRTKKGPL